MLDERLTNVSSNYTSLLKEENGLCVSSNKIESKYNKMEWVEGRDRQRKDKDCERENEGRER